MIAAKDGVIIPVQCEYLALEGLGQLTQTITRIRQGLFPELSIRGVLLTMFDGRTNLSSDVMSEVQKFFQDKVFQHLFRAASGLQKRPLLACQFRSMPLTRAARELTARWRWKC